jgi:tetratricopeptide (TPR) repeat protein
VSEEKRSSPFYACVLLVACAGLARAAQGGGDAVSEGNALYAQGQYDKAVGLYDQALTENPKLDQARFNKADAYFRMDDLAKAMDLYSEVSAQSKDMDLVKKAKYNLGNVHFQRGLKQRDSDLQKALEDLRTSITCWRAVLDLDPANENAKRNKEVAGLIIKDILDEIKKKQEQQKQQGQDPNQAQQQNQQQDPNNPRDRSQETELKKCNIGFLRP